LTQESTKAITGKKYHLFTKPKAQNGYIVDCPGEWIEFFPAGFTGPQEQTNIKALFLALSGQAEIKLEKGVSIPNILVVIDSHIQSRIGELKGIHIGSVPKRISQEIEDHLKWIKNGYIVALHERVHKKYYSTKVRLNYEPQEQTKPSNISPLSQRLVRILGW